jgi:hypothetical protein
MISVAEHLSISRLMGEVLERVRKFSAHVRVGLDEMALAKEHRKRDRDLMEMTEDP